MGELLFRPSPITVRMPKESAVTLNFETPPLVSFLITPVPEPRQSRSDAWDPSSSVLRYRAFRDELFILSKQQHFQLGTAIGLAFYLPMPASWNMKKRQQMSGTRHQTKPDTDNLIKAFVDALLDSDGDIWFMAGAKFWSDRPRIDVLMNESRTSEEAGTAGIANSAFLPSQ